MRWAARLVAAVVAAAVMMGAAVALTIGSAGTLRMAVRTGGLPDIALSPLAARSEIYAADGSLLDSFYEEDRMPIGLEHVPKVLVDAVIATEDHAFYEHDGISVRGLLRALRENATNRRVLQGGSTITQQLVKNAMLDNERTYNRKAREAVLAFRMEQEYSKEEILQRYLNTVYFGAGAHGVVAAAERFFAKPLTEMTLPEAALLAGLISSPERYDPFRHPEAARERRAHVLGRMLQLGLVDQSQVEEAQIAPLPVELHTRAAQPTRYFTEEVRRQLLDDPRLGDTPQDRFAAVFRGGIRVETTFDPRLQATAEQAVTEVLPPSSFTAALVAIDPKDGAVRALVGGPGFDAAQYNLVTQGARQAGSSFKTIALAAWLADGRSPEDVVDATAPCSFHRPPPEPVWDVDNYDGGSGERAAVSLRDATIKSSNCAYARLALVLGAEKIAAMAERLGVTRRMPHYPSIVLGTGDVSPLEMASVYATLAADGVRHEPMFIRRVLDRSGNVVFENRPSGEQVLDREIARTVTDVLRGVVERGTGTRATIGRPVAGKTGTSQEWRDAWFAGYTPQLAAAVWMGSPTSQESMIGVGGINVTGGSFPARMWSRFMGGALATVPALDFAPPDITRWPAPSAIGSMPEGVGLPPWLTPSPSPAPAPAPHGEAESVPAERAAPSPKHVEDEGASSTSRPSGKKRKGRNG